MENAKQAGKSDRVQIEIERYAKNYILNDNEVKELNWNGREMRNALQTAITLAVYRATKSGKPVGSVVEVEEDHFKNVVQISKNFKEYMRSITGKDEESRAQARHDRSDD